MKVKEGFVNYNVCGESLVVATGTKNIDFTDIISMNETADYLWKKVSAMESFTIDDLVGLLTAEYEVEAERAEADCRQLVQAWTDAGILEGDDLPPVSVAPTADRERPEQAEEKEKKPRKGFFGKLFKN